MTTPEQLSPAVRDHFASTLRRMADAIEAGALCDGTTVERRNVGDPLVNVAAHLEVWIEPTS